MTPGTSQYLSSAYGFSATNVYAVGFLNGSGQPGVGTILQFDGAGWSANEVVPALFGVWGTSPSDVFAAGSGVLHFDGTRWAAMSVPINVNSANDVLYAVHGGSATDVYAVGGDGGNPVLVHFDGASWSRLQVPVTGVNLRGVWEAPSGEVWIVGQNGTILRGTRRPLPTVETRGVTFTGNSATLTANVTPNGFATNAWFEWGTSSSLATFGSTPPQAVGSGTTAVPISANLTGLTLATTYYYRAAASSSAGTTRGTILSFTTATTPSTCEPAATQVCMISLSFYFANLTVPTGTTVTWKNGDPVMHTVTSSSLSTEIFNSGLVGQGGTFSRTFNTPGTYNYYCQIHGQDGNPTPTGMHGTITVQ